MKNIHMEEEVQLCLEITKENMENAISYLEKELGKVRAGKASPSILNGIFVDYYGVNTPLNQVANINTPDLKTVVVQPWEKNILALVEKAILAANIGLTPVNNGEVIHINIPALTEERRNQLVKQVKAEGENAKISIRNARKSANDDLRKLQNEGLSEDREKSAEDEVQEMTNDYSKKIDALLDAKEKVVMTI